jgi:membrane peptidoglycan carboxypeptidase
LKLLTLHKDARNFKQLKVSELLRCCLLDTIRYFMRLLRSPSLLFTALFLVLLINLPTHAAQPENMRKKKSTVAKSSSAKKKTTSKKQGSYSKVKSTKGRYKGTRNTVVLPNPQIKLNHEYVKPVTSPTDQNIERVELAKLSSDHAMLIKAPEFSSSYRGRVAATTKNNDFVQFTIDPDLQEYAKQILSKVPAPHVALVAMEPKTGRILAIAGKSATLKDSTVHAGFPAASLIKVITSAAAIEHGGAQPNAEVYFRGGTYELGPNNYNPNPLADKRSMTMTEALGKSCNPVFSRVGLKYLNPALFRAETAQFGFNTDLGLQMPLQTSSAHVPNDDYEFGRTAAGFGDIYLSPVHAALIASAIANQGRLLQPSIIDQIISENGDIRYQSEPQVLKQATPPAVARTVLQMMTATTTTGTSRREFLGKVPWEVAGKTGTLKGDNPQGLNNWFIGAAPLENPRIAVAVVVINPNQVSSKASHLGRLILERYLG